MARLSDDLKDENHREAQALAGLARSLAAARADLQPTAVEVEAMAGAALACGAPIEIERGFDAAARRLRAGWLKSVAAETARVLRSPTEHDIERLARARHDAYGYERDFQPESLEARCQAFFGEAPPGWSVAHVMFSSGQAALATILLQLAAARPGKLTVAHVGAYFETGELVGRACRRTPDLAQADCIIVEPIACNGRFTTHDPVCIAGALGDGQALLVDETLTAPATRLPAILAEAAEQDCIVMRLVSGLKLLQQGLELANVGIVSVFARDADRAASFADGLKGCRTLTGAGLRFVEALALEAPFFLDPGATSAYADRVFAHNASLARAVAAENRLFKPLGPDAAAQAAPYCAFELADGGGAAGLEALALQIEQAAERRGLLFERGGSFGFRGHRFEVIEPENGDCPFLRIALGARDDHSRRGLVELMAELASRPAGRACGRSLR